MVYIHQTTHITFRLPVLGKLLTWNHVFYKSRFNSTRGDIYLEDFQTDEYTHTIFLYTVLQES